MSEWNCYKLGELCTITSSKRCYLSERVELGIPFYRSKEIIQLFNNEKINNSDYLSSGQYENIKVKFGVPKANDLLLTTRGSIGIPYLITEEDKFYFADGNLTWMKDFTDLLSSRFLFYWLQSLQGKSKIESEAVGVAQKAVPIVGLKNMELKIPKIYSQHTIVGILASYDNLIENNNRRIAILEEMAQKLYREWFVHFRFPGHENIKMVESEMGLIPEGWEIKTLVNVADIIMGQSPKSECYNENGEGLPFHQGVTNFNLLIPEHKTYSTGGSRIANDGDILFSVRAPVGRINLADCKLVLGRGISSIRHKEGHQAYLLFALRSIFDKPDLIGSGSIFNSVTKDDMHSIKVLSATKSLENSFQNLAQPIVNQLISLNAKNTNLRKTRDLLLPRLISGDIDVSDLDIPIKEV